jgi:ABC-type Fe3+/spermidine/putrescine transport system ATPase subunit
MSDRVAVFNKGRIEQIAAHKLYTRPATAFVADFVGTSNVFDAAWAASLTGQQQAFAGTAGASVRRKTARMVMASACPPACWMCSTWGR